MGRELRSKNEYQIKAVADVIKSKEARGADASFERSLLKSWGKYEGWEGAKEALSSLVGHGCNNVGKLFSDPMVVVK